MSLYTVVVPVYNSEHTLEELYRRLEKVFREVIKEDFELILVDDGIERPFFRSNERASKQRSESQNYTDGKKLRPASCTPGAALRMSVEILL